MLTAIALVACGGAPSPDPAEEDPLVLVFEGKEIDLRDRPEGLQQCLLDQCAEETSEAAFATCEQDVCAEKLPAFAVEPQRIAYADGTVFAEVKLDHEPGGYGPIVVQRAGEVFVGVTVVTEAGEEIDLAVQTLFPSRLEDSFIFSADVGAGVRDVIIGAWNEKVEPCEVDRYGCREFGFVLDGALASWPPDFYTHGHRQRIPPETLVIAGTGTAEGKKALDAMLAPFDTTVNWSGRVGEGLAPGVHHRDPNDWVLAWALAGGADPIHTPELTVDLAILGP